LDEVCGSKYCNLERPAHHNNNGNNENQSHKTAGKFKLRTKALPFPDLHQEVFARTVATGSNASATGKKSAQAETHDDAAEEPEKTDVTRPGVPASPHDTESESDSGHRDSQPCKRKVRSTSRTIDAEPSPPPSSDNEGSDSSERQHRRKKARRATTEERPSSAEPSTPTFAQQLQAMPKKQKSTAMYAAALGLGSLGEAVKESKESKDHSRERPPKTRFEEAMEILTGLLRQGKITKAEYKGGAALLKADEQDAIYFCTSDESMQLEYLQVDHQFEDGTVFYK
jgi:hypothetical protein